MPHKNIEKKKQYKKEYLRIYYLKNKERASIRSKIYRENNSRSIAEHKKKYSRDNKDAIAKRGALWYQRNRVSIIIKSRQYFLKNKQRIRIRLKTYWNNRYKNDLKFHLRSCVSSSIRNKLRRRLLGKKGKPTFSFLPYTLDQLISHLEKQFTEGMTWQNHGKWHIDHIKPDSSFDYKSVEDFEFQKCWALENLQPLWAYDNLQKSNKLV